MLREVYGGYGSKYALWPAEAGFLAGAPVAGVCGRGSIRGKGAEDALPEDGYAFGVGAAKVLTLGL